MARFIKSSIMFAIVALVGYFLLINAWYYIPVQSLKPNALYPIGGKGYLLSRINELDEEAEIDLLFLGSSHTYRGFDTRIFRDAGYTSFNLGSSSQTPIQTQYLLDKYLDQLNPKLIIYEVYPSTFQNDGVESSIDVIANTELDLKQINMAFEIGHLKTWNTLLIDLLREPLGLNNSVTQKRFENDQYISGGFVSTDIYENQSPINDQMKAGFANSRWEIKHKQWSAFKKILQGFRQNNYPFLLVQMPLTDDAYALYLNNDEMDILFDYQGPYINLNNELELDNQYDFMDYHHLNQQGVEKTNQYLVKELAKYLKR